MPESYHVRVTKDYLVFSAAHFITIGDNICERLHGHNYRIAAEVYGPLNENQYVFDFIALRDALRQLVDELDHYVLLPMQHPTIQVTATEKEVEARFEDRRWVFPRGDCVLLPVANTTAELVARYIGLKLIDMLASQHGARPERVVIELDECNGQLAVWKYQSTPHAPS
ncbi:MAG: 6-pyruvoyl tetrahydropterin synthase family protein [Planctomycetota bacterium]|nr:6-pyruvoyl tetrahydropterin synthase family protein [Planctomycetota bacterium]